MSASESDYTPDYDDERTERSPSRSASTASRAPATEDERSSTGSELDLAAPAEPPEGDAASPHVCDPAQFAALARECVAPSGAASPPCTSAGGGDAGGLQLPADGGALQGSVVARLRASVVEAWAPPEAAPEPAGRAVQGSAAAIRQDAERRTQFGELVYVQILNAKGDVQRLRKERENLETRYKRLCREVDAQRRRYQDLIKVQGSVERWTTGQVLRPKKGAQRSGTVASGGQGYGEGKSSNHAAFNSSSKRGCSVRDPPGSTVPKHRAHESAVPAVQQREPHPREARVAGDATRTISQRKQLRHMKADLEDIQRTVAFIRGSPNRNRNPEWKKARRLRRVEELEKEADHLEADTRDLQKRVCVAGLREEEGALTAVLAALRAECLQLEGEADTYEEKIQLEEQSAELAREQAEACRRRVPEQERKLQHYNGVAAAEQRKLDQSQREREAQLQHERQGLAATRDKVRAASQALYEHKLQTDAKKARLQHSLGDMQAAERAADTERRQTESAVAAAAAGVEEACEWLQSQEAKLAEDVQATARDTLEAAGHPTRRTGELALELRELSAARAALESDLAEHDQLADLVRQRRDRQLRELREAAEIRRASCQRLLQGAG